MFALLSINKYMINVHLAVSNISNFEFLEINSGTIFFIKVTVSVICTVRDKISNFVYSLRISTYS